MIKTKKNDLNVEIKSAITYLDNILKLKKEILLAEKLILKTFKNKKKNFNLWKRWISSAGTAFSG